MAARWAESERDRLAEIGIESATVTAGGERLGDRTRDLAFTLFDAWRANVLGDG